MEEHPLKNYHPDTDPRFLDGEAAEEQLYLDINSKPREWHYYDSDLDTDPRFT